MMLAMMIIGDCAIAAEPVIAGDVTPSTPSVSYGSRIQRTMHQSATSTPERRNKVRILVYGQSISNGPWVDAVRNKLKADINLHAVRRTSLSVVSFDGLESSSYGKVTPSPNTF